MSIQGSAYQMAFHTIPDRFAARVRGLIEGVCNPLGGILGGFNRPIT